MPNTPTTNSMRCMEMTHPMTKDNPYGECQRLATVWIKGGAFHGLRLCDRCIQYYCTVGAKVLPLPPGFKG